MSDLVLKVKFNLDVQCVLAVLIIENNPSAANDERYEQI